MEDIVTMNAKEQLRAELMALLKARRLTQADVAERLRISVRQVKRLFRDYKRYGMKGLVSKRRGQPSNNRLPTQLQQQIVAKIEDKYKGFGPKFTYDKLTENDGFNISLTRLRHLMIEHRLWQPRVGKVSKIHPRRERRPRFGELIQTDGSIHAWFEDRGPKCSLIVCIDDATSRLTMLRFAPVESIEAYFLAVKAHILRFGRPEAIYSDKHSIFRVNHGGKMDTSITQFARAMKELDIRTICAHSPQAKGRVERANGTLQDRLVNELRLRGISTIDEANAFALEYLEDHNRRYAVTPKDPTDAHKQLDDSHDLTRIFSIHHERTVSKSLSFQFANVHYQLLVEGRKAHALQKKKVTVMQHLSGKIEVFYGKEELTFTTVDLIPQAPATVDSKIINHEFERWVNKGPGQKPKDSHPWKSQNKIG